MIPMKWQRIANSRDRNITAIFGDAHNWRHNWQWEMFDAGPNAQGQAQLSVLLPDGEDILFTEASANTWSPPDGVDKQLFQHGNNFLFQYANGQRCRFQKLSDNTIFYQMQEIRDPEQNLFVLTYESAPPHRLLRVTEPAGRFFDISYGNVGSRSVLTRVTTNDGRTVDYTYGIIGSFVALSSAIYGDGTSATYSYTQVDPAVRPLLSHATDPRYEGRGTDMQYTYANNLGVVQDELNSTGQVLFTMTSTSNSRTDTYANGDVDVFIYPQRQRGNLDNLVDGLGRMTDFQYANNGRGFLLKRIDGLGRVTKYARSLYGNPLIVVRPDKSQEIWTRDDLDLPLSYTDELGRVTTYTRDASHRVREVDYPDNTFESFNYNDFGQVLDHRRRNEGVEHNVYDARGLKTSFQDAEGNITQYGYDSADRLASILDTRGNTMRFQYNERGLLTRKINPDGSHQTFDYDAFGNQIKRTDELGHMWTRTYDEFRRVVDATDPLGRITRFEYGFPTSFEESYDKPTKITLPSGLVITNRYHARWQLLSRTVGDGSADAATTAYEYDDVGNMIHKIDPRGNLWVTEYDVRNRKHAFTDPLGNRTQWDHDAVGNITAITRPDGGITRNEFDAMNRVIRTRDPKDEITQMAYDAEDNMINLTDTRGNQYQYTYDLLNRKLSLIYPDSSHEDWTWDPVSNLATYKTRAGQTRTYVYDARNRETDSSWDDGITPSISRTYDDASQLLTMNSSVSALTYTYTDANELETETQAIAGAGSAKTIRYAYNEDGLRNSLTYPDGILATYSYTGRNQVATISDGSGPIDPLVRYSYDPNGNRAGKMLDNGTATDYVYDEANRLTHIAHRNGAGTFSSFDYVYDSVDRRTSVTHQDASVDLFAYDPIDQVIGVNYGADNRSVSYLYDNAGNRRSVTDNGVTTRYKTNDLNEYTRVGGSFLGYDVNGNLTTSSGARLSRQDSEPSWTYSFDAQNRLIIATNGKIKATYAYDSRNRRVRQTIDGATTFFYFDIWSLIDERDAADVEQARYINGALLDEILRKTAPASAVYYHHDAIGDVTDLTDGTGAVVEKYSYDVFGAPTITNGSGNVTVSSAYGNRFLFTGREFISELNLYDFRNRFYSYQFGRFLQTDLSNYDPTNLAYKLEQYEHLLHPNVYVYNEGGEFLEIQINTAYVYIDSGDLDIYIADVESVLRYIWIQVPDFIVPGVEPWLYAYRNLYAYVLNDPINLRDVRANLGLGDLDPLFQEFFSKKVNAFQVKLQNGYQLFQIERNCLIISEHYYMCPISGALQVVRGQ